MKEGQARKINKSIRRVSLYLALKKNRYAAMVFLLIDLVLRVFYKYPITGLYVIIAYLVLPILLEFMIKQRMTRSMEESLPHMQKQFHYNRQTLIALIITSILANCLLVLWHIELQKAELETWQMQWGAAVIILCSVIIIIAEYFNNSMKIHKGMKNNNL